jgi:hypothetical protein
LLKYSKAFDSYKDIAMDQRRWFSQRNDRSLLTTICLNNKQQHSKLAVKSKRGKDVKRHTVTGLAACYLFSIIICLMVDSNFYIKAMQEQSDVTKTIFRKTLIKHLTCAHRPNK